MEPIRFKADPILKGNGDYGYWAYGGYNPDKDKGQFRIAVSPCGEPLKEVRRLREPNGRHVLSLVYPGCYILQAECSEYPVIDMKFYRIQEIDSESGHVVCERVLEEDFTQIQYDRMMSAMDLARSECIVPYNQNNHYYWRVQHE